LKCFVKLFTSIAAININIAIAIVGIDIKIELTMVCDFFQNRANHSINGVGFADLFGTDSEL